MFKDEPPASRLKHPVQNLARESWSGYAAKNTSCDDSVSVVNNINNTYIGNMDPLAILLHCQAAHIVLRNVALVHIVPYCQEPNILAI
jgi:hypothetical protein